MFSLLGTLRSVAETFPKANFSMFQKLRLYFVHPSVKLKTINLRIHPSCIYWMCHFLPRRVHPAPARQRTHSQWSAKITLLCWWNSKRKKSSCLHLCQQRPRLFAKLGALESTWLPGDVLYFKKVVFVISVLLWKLYRTPRRLSIAHVELPRTDKWTNT